MDKSDFHKLEFEIKGGPRVSDGEVYHDPEANPMPKLKMTGNQHWTPKAKRYVQWKEQVANSFLSAYGDWDVNLGDVVQIDPNNPEKPIHLPDDQKAVMMIHIYWKNNNRGDPENIFGSIADALFAEDKNLAGSFDLDIEPTGKGLVLVHILFPKQLTED